jgi:hypothetical protein
LDGQFVLNVAIQEPGMQVPTESPKPFIDVIVVVIIFVQTNCFHEFGEELTGM